MDEEIPTLLITVYASLASYSNVFVKGGDQNFLCFIYVPFKCSTANTQMPI